MAIVDPRPNLWTRRALTGAALATGATLATGCASRPVAPHGVASGPLRIAARPDVLEVGPILHAAGAMGAGRVVVSGGGVPNLIDGPVAGAIDSFPGRADAAGQAETQLLRLSVANPDLRIVMTVTEGVYRIVARRSAGITRVADLAGKRVGIFERTSAAFFLHRMLDHVGLGDADIVRVALRPGDMAKAMIEQRVDAIAIWEPESERAVRALGADAVTFADPDVYREFYNLNTTAAALADPVRRAALVALMRALVLSCRISAERPGEVWPLVAASSGFPAELVAAGWPHHRFPATLAPALLDTMVAEERWLAAQDGRAPRTRPELDRLIDRTLLAEAGIRS
ncbi:ABC transporter substrate-binding protein [Sphingomonas suaedae]|uniref:ABC transporter substrate-binding protein n=1 Tax=Sphingomonas suaedae TaxID=2599297 RepID=A0A518RJR2_9SPHN|nr:ABC transporter substrate-binding protein [Sphingomonas suaedae]